MDDISTPAPKSDATEIAEWGANTGERRSSSRSVARGLSLRQDDGGSVRVLLLRKHPMPAVLVERVLTGGGHHVTTVRDLAGAWEEVGLRAYDIAVIGESVSINEKLRWIKDSSEKHSAIPTIMLFEPGMEQEATLAREAGASDCIVRDEYGEYLIRVPASVGRLVARQELKDTGALPREERKEEGEIRALPREERKEEEEITDVVALAEIMKSATKASKAQRACLVVRSGQDVGKSLEIGQNAYMLGRDPACQLSLCDDGISRFHASVRRSASGVVYIKDLDSTNGTFVNDKRVRVTRLAGGDTILLGANTFIRYQIENLAEREYHEQLYAFATRDGLTGLYNRRCCIDRIRSMMSYARRHRRAVSIMLFDLDHFKGINDQFGHQTGDRVLAAVAETLGRSIRNEDLLGRYGGEEFLLFALDTDSAGAKILSERLRRAVEDCVVRTPGSAPERIRVTVSIGVATESPGDAYDLDALIRLADENLYKAKGNGRNCVVGTV